jgi:DNA repair protein RadA/Sms
MAKPRTLFFCNQCGYQSPRWMGKCPECEEWNSFVEEKIVKDTKSSLGTSDERKQVLNLNSIVTKDEDRFSSGFEEFDRVLGGGIVRGSLVLVGGDPGIGKSTILIQTSSKVADLNKKVLYISGEESPRQIKMRAERLSISSDNMYLLGETNIELIKDEIIKMSPDFVVIDSIQTMFCSEITSAPGSVSQVREATLALMNLAKGLGIPIFIVGHVTKQGAIAGPRVLEHMVDTVLYFEGEQHYSYRILRGVKNRFGSTNEIGIFEMKDVGLVEVTSPSELFLSQRPKSAPGTVVISSIEGTRPMLIELQALTSQTVFGMPRRMATGVDHNRMSVLIAVLEKRVGLALGNIDVYLNVVGGIKINEPSADLGIVSAIASSFRNIPIAQDTAVLGEVGLTGEIRGVSFVEKRIMEAKKLGFTKCIVPAYNLKGLEKISGIEIIGVEDVEGCLEIILGR